MQAVLVVSNGLLRDAQATDFCSLNLDQHQITVFYEDVLEEPNGPEMCSRASGC